jgi:protocatechuate 3,4-dioxygenase beta subunit
VKNDDVTVGRILSRREALEALGAAGVVVLAGGPVALAQSRVPRCVVVPAQTEGPYFVDEKLNRGDIRPDPSNGKTSEGVPLDVSMRVYQLGAGCVPLAGAMVDLWQCDAMGIYSDVQDKIFDTRGQKFLRGHQISDKDGLVKFRTVYPGWYPGRAVHIHFKIRTNPGGGRGTEFVSQLYFNEAMNDEIFKQAPYSAHKGQRRLNSEDGIYRNGGKDLMLPVAKTGSVYAGTFELALKTTSN